MATQAPRGLFQQVDPFDDEAPFLLARTAAPQEAPQPLDPLVPVGEGAHGTVTAPGVARRVT